jgi:two-component system OmpR family sensor kinase
MRTIRGRLVVSYAVALVATMTVFAGTIYLVQRSENFAELDARARLEADLIAELLAGAARGPDPIVVQDRDNPRPHLASSLESLLQVLQDYVIVLTPDGSALFMSEDARALPYGSFVRLVELATGTAPERLRFGLADLGPPAGEVRYVVRSISAAGPDVAWVVSGASTAGLVLGPRRLLTAMLLTAPLVIGLSVLIGHFLVGRTLEPVNVLVDEVEAITDGRTLHRRLAEPRSHDELARLTLTLNAMLSRLEGSFASLRRFTADASHELKTPLTVLRSGIERAITHPKAPPDVMEVLEETLVEVNRMAELVDALLTLARADEGRAPLHLEAVALHEVLGEVSETASMLGEQAHVAVSVNVPDQPITMAMDRSRVRQLLMNLLSNAIKYTPQGGEVAIDCAQVGAQVVVSVRDTGVGIAPGDLPHIFDRFWRADQARSRTGDRPGVGLGLAISKWIAEAHGGTITVQSRPGRGTTFTVTLPTGAG